MLKLPALKSYDAAIGPLDFIEKLISCTHHTSPPIKMETRTEETSRSDSDWSLELYKVWPYEIEGKIRNYCFQLSTQRETKIKIENNIQEMSCLHMENENARRSFLKKFVPSFLFHVRFAMSMSRCRRPIYHFAIRVPLRFSSCYHGKHYASPTLPFLEVSARPHFARI